VGSFDVSGKQDYPNPEEETELGIDLTGENRLPQIAIIATAKTVRTFLIPETLDSTPLLP
jgi:hypothetical protein